MVPLIHFYILGFRGANELKKYKKIINYITVVSFFLIIAILAILQPLMKDNKTSLIERRRLEQFPVFTINKLMSNQWFGSFENYLLDQFPFREAFKNLDNNIKQEVLKIGDIEGVYNVGPFLSKILYPMNDQDVIHNAEKIAKLYDRYLKGLNVYITIVPDKGYFTAEQNGYPYIQYDKMMALLKSHLPKELYYIDIFPLLKIEDYYFTDAHWRQEKIFPVVDKIADIMALDILPLDAYDVNSFKNFKGVYYGRTSNSFESETLNYLTNDKINHMEVTYAGKTENQMVYNPNLLENLDAYDVFLGGPQPFIEIINKETTSNRELIVFRDSFASSLTPLLLNAYSKITLIDLRYIEDEQLQQYVTFSKQDVLFLYNTTVINNRFNFK